MSKLSVVSPLAKAPPQFEGSCQSKCVTGKGPRGANRCCDFDAYRLRTLEAKLGVKERSCPMGLGSTPHKPAHRLLR